MAVDTTRLSSKGQLVIPKEIRDRHGWAAGTEFVVEDDAGTITLRPAKPFAPTTIDDVVGFLNYAGPPVSVEEMDEAVAAKARRRWDEFERRNP